ncbi:lysophospholipase L1-like esterase [Ruminiclostridium sufflavum DSM 19573]|uniref:cellulase n=1 Tax=Ruminiclostridium sufflavum DSM 19573 TaxID=1121337 RepID=A0A318XKA0_9FIRM|nr:SGNH/GDSL hydrolase family protein [Ruminiclostridium sufflavum]PYG86888.1 lysophospholipase L1-like esterase [Ruminiclostridium sufflavum DSM 19573]
MMSIKKIKKAGVFIAVFVLLFTVLFPISAVNAASVISAEAESGRLYGDINEDQSVDALDFALFKKYLLDSSQTVEFLGYMDLNLDNRIDVLDFAVLKRYLLGIIDTLPEGTIPAAPGVQYIGRFDTSDPEGPKFAWSASTIKANFTGTGISAKLKSIGDNYFNVIIDGAVKAPINTPAGSSAAYILASGLSNGTHTVELVKRTEASIGEVQFLGFTVAGGNLLAPADASSKRIEFIGDSITCGYGNEGTTQYQSFTSKNENAYMAYGAVTGRLLGAEVTTVCWSGKGVVQNYGGNKEDLMPSLYSRILPYDSTKVWDYTKWVPDVVVINLGTNDISTVALDGTRFTAEYSKLADKIRSQYPEAHIYCAVGPMLYGETLENMNKYVGTVVNDKKTSGDNKVHFIEFPQQDQANGYGEDWHPTVKTHQIMADQLAAQIKKDLGW